MESGEAKEGGRGVMVCGPRVGEKCWVRGWLGQEERAILCISCSVTEEGAEDSERWAGQGR